MKLLVVLVVVLIAIYEVAAQCTADNFPQVRERRLARIRDRLARVEAAKTCDELPQRRQRLAGQRIVNLFLNATPSTSTTAEQLQSIE